MEEIWKNIRGYKDYQVSNLGNVKSLNYNNSNKEQLLIPQKLTKGYLGVRLYKNHSYKSYRVHRLVYEAFYGKIPFWMVINHIDENPSNNQLSNLMLCTYKENTNWGTAKDRFKLMSKPILQYDLSGNFIKEWKSGKEIEKQLGYDSSHIYACCKNKTHNSNKGQWTSKTAYGFIWRYSSDTQPIPQ